MTPEQEQKKIIELSYKGSHDIPGDPGKGDTNEPHLKIQGIYDQSDLVALSPMKMSASGYSSCLHSLEELLERDKQRDKDGFPRKIRLGRLIKVSKGVKDKVVIVPTTVEEKFIHDKISPTPDEEDASGGSGDGEEGEVIGEQPVHDPNGSSAGGAGQGEDGPHELESSAYDLGKILTEKFELPNLKTKGNKRSLSRYTFDMTDKNRGFGQFLDKKATLKKIVETNIQLGNVPDVNNIDPTRFLISPRDKVYRILSREKDYDSQAMVFFVRDYSASMEGKATEMVVTQHVLIYSWLLYQYARQVETRFILHDTEATEVKDFQTYYNLRVAGGTQVVSAYRLVNEIVEKENLAKDYNIYMFQGTDGDDWDTDGREAIPELKKILTYANRVGISVVAHTYGPMNDSEVERYIKQSGLLAEKPALIRMDVMKEDTEEKRLIEGIKYLIS
jgi:uncharacterized protein